MGCQFLETENINWELPEQSNSTFSRILFMYIYTLYTITITTSKTFSFDVICPCFPCYCTLDL